MVFNYHSKFLLLLLIAFSASHLSVAHAFYVSVYSVNFDDDLQEVRVVCKVFTNDLEDAVKKKNAIHDLVINEWSDPQTREKTVNYILQKTKITLNNKQKTLIFDHFSWEGSDVTEITLCHFKIKNVSYVKSFGIDTDLLTELYDDQVNIINVRVGDKRKALNLDKRVNQGKLAF